MRLGLLGAGAVVEGLHLPVLRARTDISIEWICDSVKERAVRLAHGFGIRNAFERLEDCSDVDAVLVAIPVGLRRAALDMIFSRKWHAFCEKPFATSILEYEHIVRTAAANDVEVGVALMRRFYHATRLARQLVLCETFGSVLAITASDGARARGMGRVGDWYQTDRRAAGGGILTESGSHLLDQAFAIVAAEDCAITGYEQSECDGLEFDVNLSAAIRTTSGASVPARFQLSRSRDLANGIRITFERAVVGLDCTANSHVRIVGFDGGNVVNLDRPPLGATEPYQAFYMEWGDFIRQCAYREPTDVSVQTCRLSIAVIEDAYAIASRRPNSG